MLSALAPTLAARLGERMFLTPPRPRPSAHEATARATARVRSLPIGRHRVDTWAWGSGPTVLLVHGWGGRGAQMAAFVAPLVGRGFSVVAFDAPGHGVSDEGLVTLPEMTAAVRAVAAAHPPVRGIIAHSIGVTAVARAVREGLAVDAAVFLAGPADLVTPALQVATALGLSPRVLDSMQRRIERRVGMPWSAFDVTRLAPAEPFPMLVVHDRGDGEVPWQHGRRIAQAWPGAELLETDGLGHRRILRDPRVVAAATVFLGAHAAARRREDAPIPVSLAG